MTDEPEDAEASDAPRSKKKKIKRRIPKAKSEREPSKISFPYQDLENAISVSRAMLGAGGVALSRDQLAGVMNLVVGSGNFVLKIATARMFGLVNFVGGKYELSTLGFSIVDTDEKRQRAARAEAFLNVPLYKRVYEEFKGKQLPPRPHGLEQAFVKFGVAPKQKAVARQVFDKSATQAGYFPSGPDRLIEPIVGGASASARAQGGALAEAVSAPTASDADARSADTSGLAPFVQVLIDSLPEPGTNWTIEARAKWLQAAAALFEITYKGSGEIKIVAESPKSETA